MTAIQITGLQKRFGAKVAVDQVSLDIPSGAFHFLLGPSGCGKTTLLRLIAGLEQPDAGDIRFNDTSIIHTPVHRRNATLVFQHYALWPHMTVEQNVAYGLEERGVARDERRARVMQALERVRISELRERYPDQLSGGQQQRVALARALVVQPAVVLLDEPLSNLDARLREEMRNELISLHAETGMTLVYVTHDQHEALSMATGITIMNQGRIEQAGSPSAVYARPRNRFVADFLGAANWIPGTVAAAAGPYVNVTTALGPLRGIPADAPLQAGTKASCMVRPEELRLVPQPDDNIIEARVLRRVFLGAAHELHLRGAETELRLIHPGHCPDTVQPGTSVRIGFPPSATLLFKDAAT